MRAEIINAEARAWLAANPSSAGSSIVTSLPDRSELPALDFERWRGWFIEAARDVLRWLPHAGVAIFYQSDVLHRGAWIDKSHLLMLAADAEGAALRWHKIVCRKPAGTPAAGRASYSHMLCFARADDGTAPRPFGPDVLEDAGGSSWTRGMGLHACRLACAYLREATATTQVIDPFCGQGSVLAVAAELGFDVIGVELHARRCRAARARVNAAAKRL